MNQEICALEIEKRPTLLKDVQLCTLFIRHSPLIRIGLIFEFSFIFIVILFFIIRSFLYPSWSTFIAHDFRVFYDAVTMYRNSPELLYSSSPQHFPFRYLPAFVYLFYLYTLIPFEIGFILHTIFMGFIHVVNFYFIYILTIRFYHASFSTKKKETLLFIALVAPVQIPNLVLGQISEIYIFLTLLGIIFLENAFTQHYIIHGNYFWAGLCFGISFLYKPIAILLGPFFFLIERKGNHKSILIGLRSSFYLWIGFCLPFLSNFIVWIQNPTLIRDFIHINASTQIWTYPSTSVTRLILLGLFSVGVHIADVWVYLPLTLMLYVGVLIFYFKFPVEKRNFSFFFGITYLIFMLTYPDSWFLYFLIWYMISLPGWLSQENILQIQYQATRLAVSLNRTFSAFYYLIQYGIIYFIFGILLAMYVLGFDPLLPLCVSALFGLSLWRLAKEGKKNHMFITLKEIH